MKLKRILKFYIVFTVLMYGGEPASTQVYSPVKWTFSMVPTDEGHAWLMFTASLEEGWHIYSQFISRDGPLPTTFNFVPGKYTLVDKMREEGNAVSAYDPTFMTDITWFASSVTFVQKIK